MPAKAPPDRSTSLSSIALAGAVSSGLTFGYFSGDAACSSISVAIAGGILTAILAKLFQILISKRTVALWVVPIVSTTAVAAVLGAEAYVDLRERTFVDAFGVSPPPDVRDLWVDCSYAGGPGDTVTVMRFAASPATVDQLIAASGLKEAEDYHLKDYLVGKESWDRVWDRQFLISKDLAPAAWRMPAPMAKPRLHVRGSDWEKQKLVQSMRILWDQTTGEVYVMVTRG